MDLISAFSIVKVTGLPDKGCSDIINGLSASSMLLEATTESPEK